VILSRARGVCTPLRGSYSLKKLEKLIWPAKHAIYLIKQKSCFWAISGLEKNNRI
jgi:hypothetical protein